MAVDLSNSILVQESGENIPAKKEKTFTQWSAESSRFLVSNAKGARSRSGDGDDCSVGRRRPYLYSGLPVQTLRHELPWAVKGPFELTSNREALQDTKGNKVRLTVPVQGIKRTKLNAVCFPFAGVSEARPVCSHIRKHLKFYTVPIWKQQGFYEVLFCQGGGNG